MGMQFDSSLYIEIIKNTSDAIIMANLEGQIVFVNDSAISMFGYDEARELIGNNLSVLMGSNDALAHDAYLEAYARTNQSNFINTGETRPLVAHKKNGSVFSISMTLNEIEYQGERFYASFIRDISQRVQSEERIKNSLDHLLLLKAAIDSSSDYMFLIEYPVCRLIEVNNTAIVDLGIDYQNISSISPKTIFHEIDASTLLEDLDSMEQDGPNSIAYETTLKTADNEVIPVEVFFNTIRYDNSDILVLVARNISERIQYRTELEESEKRLLNAQKIGKIGSWEWDVKSKHVSCSNEALRILDIDGDTSRILDDEFFRLFFDADDKIIDEIQMSVLGNIRYSEEFHIYDKSGNERTVYLIAEIVQEQHKSRVIISGTVQDITDRKNIERELEYLSNYDSLTGLPNRRFGIQQIQHMISNARLTNEIVAILFIDIDNFKRINDNIGHDVGDDYLIAIGQIIKSQLRSSDVIARFGGDEFVVALSGLNTKRTAETVSKKIFSALSNKLIIKGSVIRPRISVGISIFPEDDTDTDTLIKYADLAMYSAKKIGKNSYRLYSDELNEQASKFHDLEKLLYEALQNNLFYLVYQPQVDLHSSEIIGVEALLRINAPDGKYISPADFVPVLEETGLIHDVGKWIIKTAFDQIKIFQAYGLPSMRMSINISSTQFENKDFVHHIIECIDSYGINPNLIELEITESVLIKDKGEITRTLQLLKDAGVNLSIDDFGTGYSSLSYIKSFPIDSLKIDRSFVTDLHENDSSRTLITSILALANSLELNTIAEGVENFQQARYLSENGCNEAQGFFYSKPVSGSDLISYFINNNSEEDKNYNVLSEVILAND